MNHACVDCTLLRVHSTKTKNVTDHLNTLTRSTEESMQCRGYEALNMDSVQIHGKLGAQGTDGTLRPHFPKQNLIPGPNGLLEDASQNLQRQDTTVPGNSFSENGPDSASHWHECPYATAQAAGVELGFCELCLGQDFRHASQGFRAAI